MMYQATDRIAVITLDNPPVNTLAHNLRGRLMEAIHAAEEDPDVLGVVIAGGKRAFSAGAEVTEFGTPLQLKEPSVPQILARIEACRKPVVAAIDGVALGGGFELALACHARVATMMARLGLPEITLGLIPGAGGTQRLPRLTGVSVALSMIQSGQPRSANDLIKVGAVDDVVEGDVIDCAVRKARSLADTSLLPRARDRQLDAGGTQTLIDDARRGLSTQQRLQPAHLALLDAMTCTTRPFDEGLRREREIFLSLVSTAESAALRYVFKAERLASKLTNELNNQPETVHSIAVIGAGTMGVGIAICALDAEFGVLLVDRDEASLTKGTHKIEEHYSKQLAAGRSDATSVALTLGRLSSTLDWGQLSMVDVVIEAVCEDSDVKRDVFKRIDAHARHGAILATNTSYLDIDAIAQVTSRPGAVVGLHFFSPAAVMKLLEVVRASETDSKMLATAMDLGRRLGKMPVLVRNGFGFIGNRIYNAFRRQCEFMLEDGAWPEDVDNALVGKGFAMGPFALADLSGLDIAWRMRKEQAANRDPGERYVEILDRLCELGRLGRKTGAGYYVYSDDQKARTTDDVVRKVIEQASKKRGITRTPLASAQIWRRALLAMANEAALLLAEGIAARPSDIDVVMVHGYGFPRWEGGPVFWARRQDRSQLESDLNQLIASSGYGAAHAEGEVLDRLLAAS
jgi:3-hydroxyacyl-CoA dehydrogenase